MSDPNFIEKIEEISKESTPFKHIQAMDYPRMAGTEGEQKATEYIEAKFREYGFEPKVEEFYLPEASAISKLILPLLFVTWGIFSYINVIYISGILGYLFGFLILLVPVLLFLVILKLEVFFKKMLARNFQRIKQLTRQIEEGNYHKAIKRGKNIYVEYIPENYDEHLYLTAHHDSTTLKLNTKIIKILGILGLLGGIIYILSYLFHYLLLIRRGFNLLGSYPLFFLVILIIFLSSMSVILFGRVFRSNESHGASDNLTGIALILELAHIAKQIRPKLKITFITFSGEEGGLFGSAYHFYTHQDYFQQQKMHVVSIDMIGEIPPLTFVNKIKPALSIPLDTEFNNKMRELAQKLEIQIKFGKFVYPGSDFANWFLNGYRTNWVCTMSKYYHSPRDLPANVNQTLLTDCLKLFTAYLLEKTNA